MRPALVTTLLVAAMLSVLPVNSGAQTSDNNASPGDARSDAQQVGQSQGVAPQSKEEIAEARRLARLEQIKEEERLRQERARQCIIKPVMTDAEIARCKEVWR